MTPEEFVATFETVAEAPGGIRKLREMVLALALHGKLSNQDANDESAAALLARIAQLGDKRKLSADEGDDQAAGIPVDDYPALPETWRWTPVGEVADCVLGKMLDQAKHTKGTRRPYLRNINVRWGSFDTTDLLEMFFEDDELDRYGVKLGDVLLCEGGEPGRAAVWTDPSRTMFIQKAIHRVRLQGGILPQWLVLNLRFDSWTNQLGRYFTGATIQHFTGRALARYRIRLAPVAEQRRALFKVDQLMALCDDLEARQAKKRETAVRLNRAALDALTSAEGPEEVAASFRRIADNFATLAHLAECVFEIRKAVIELAVRGYLVRQDPRDEPAVELLKRAKVEVDREQARKRRRVVPPSPVSGSDHPPLPPGWTATRWAEVGLCQNGRGFPSTDYSDHGVKLLRPGNLHVSSAVVWTSANTRYLPERHLIDNPDFVVGCGELVMNLTAQSLKDEFLGRVCMTGENERCLLNQRIARLTPFGLLPRYLIWYFRSPFFRRYVDGLNSGTLIQHMFTSQVDEAVILIPPLAEQARIVAKVDQLMALCDTLEAALRRAESTAQKLAEAVVAEIVA